MLQVLYETIRDHRHGPIYLHCCNGWHASGPMAARIRRQFRGFSVEESSDYWDRNTDANNEHARYERIRQRIRDFEPLDEFVSSKEEAALICP